MAESILELSGDTVNVVAATLVKRDGSFLMIQESKPSAHGLWNFLGGKVDFGETVFEAAVRECKEESGLDIRLTAVAEVSYELWKTNSRVMVRYAFWGEVVPGSEETYQTDGLDVAWKTEAELRTMIAEKQLRGGYTYRLADVALSGRTASLSMVFSDAGDPTKLT